MFFDDLIFHHLLPPGNLCMVTGGANLGRIGVITNRERHPGSFDVVHVKDSTGNSFATRLSNIFVIGKVMTRGNILTTKILFCNLSTPVPSEQSMNSLLHLRAKLECTNCRGSVTIVINIKVPSNPQRKTPKQNILLSETEFRRLSEQ